MKLSHRRMSWRNVGILAAVGAALVMGLAGCYPGGPENLGEIGVVVTLKNPNGNFQGLKTYGMSDEVFPLVDPDDPNSQPINPAFNAAILEELNSQMVAAGFTLEPDPENNKPDVWVRVGAVESTVWVYYYSGGWPGYPGYGWYYPPYVGATSYQQGTLLWDLQDLRKVEDPDAKPIHNWVATVNGALQQNVGTTEAGIRKAIGQAFSQSPYIAGTPTK